MLVSRGGLPPEWFTKVGGGWSDDCRWIEPGVCARGGGGGQRPGGIHDTLGRAHRNLPYVHPECLFRGVSTEMCDS